MEQFAERIKGLRSAQPAPVAGAVTSALPKLLAEKAAKRGGRNRVGRKKTPIGAQPLSLHKFHNLQHSVESLVERPHHPTNPAQRRKRNPHHAEFDLEAKFGPDLAVKLHRLRKKLREYYEHDGRTNPVRIAVVARGHSQL